MTPAVFHLISRHRKVAWVEKRGAARISDETLSGVLEIASQMDNNSWRNSKIKFAKFYGN